MIVFQINLEIFLLEELPSDKAMEAICKFIDCSLCKEEKFIDFHKERAYKNYCFNSLYPVSKDKIYHKGRKYKLQIRTVSMEIAELFARETIETNDRIFQVIDTKIVGLQKKMIDKLYSITPCVLRIDNKEDSSKAYWHGNICERDFIKSIQNNLEKKYQYFTGYKIEEEFEMFREVKFINRQPIRCEYKGVHLLGDKLDLMISEHKMAQELAYFALGVGILEKNARGFGFVNDKWQHNI